MILAGQLISSGATNSVVLERGWIELHGHLIVDRGVGRCPHQIDLGDDDTLISPGLIDPHVHLPQFDIIGANGMTLLDWLQKIVFPAEARWEDVGFAESMIARVYRQFISMGTTSFLAFATVHHKAAMSALEMARGFGFRCAIGQVMMDRQAPDYLVRPTGQLAAETEQLLVTIKETKGSRVSGAVAPRFAISCSDELLEAAGQLAATFNALVETHLAEAQEECDIAKRLFPGASDYTDVYERFGLITPRTLFGHCIWLSEGERLRLAGGNAVAVHCPVANTFLQSGIFDLNAAQASNLRLAVGSDVGAGYERSMVRVAKAVIETAIHRGNQPPTPEQMWWQITAGNASALGWANLTGHLKPGWEADICIVRPTIPWRTTFNPLGTVMYGWDDRWIEKVIVGGNVMW